MFPMVWWRLGNDRSPQQLVVSPLEGGPTERTDEKEDETREEFLSFLSFGELSCQMEKRSSRPEFVATMAWFSRARTDASNKTTFNLDQSETNLPLDFILFY